jgi:hypothetical protein
MVVKRVQPAELHDVKCQGWAVNQACRLDARFEATRASNGSTVPLCRIHARLAERTGTMEVVRG